MTYVMGYILFAPFRGSLEIEFAVSDSGGDAFDVGSERAVARETRSVGAHGIECALDAATGPQRRAVFETLCGGEQLYREQLLRILHDRTQLGRRRHAHRYMVFFAAGGRQIVHARRA